MNITTVTINHHTYVSLSDLLVFVYRQAEQYNRDSLPAREETLKRLAESLQNIKGG